MHCLKNPNPTRTGTPDNTNIKKNYLRHHSSYTVLYYNTLILNILGNLGVFENCYCFLLLYISFKYSKEKVTGKIYSRDKMYKL